MMKTTMTVTTVGEEEILRWPLSMEDREVERAAAVEIFGDDDFVERQHGRR